MISQVRDVCCPKFRVAGRGGRLGAVALTMPAASFAQATGSSIRTMEDDMADQDESAKLSGEPGQQLEKDIDKDDPRPSKQETDGLSDEAAKEYQEG